MKLGNIDNQFVVGIASLGWQPMFIKFQENKYWRVSLYWHSIGKGEMVSKEAKSTRTIFLERANAMWCTRLEEKIDSIRNIRHTIRYHLNSARGCHLAHCQPNGNWDAKRTGIHVPVRSSAMIWYDWEVCILESLKEKRGSCLNVFLVVIWLTSLCGHVKDVPTQNENVGSKII